MKEDGFRYLECRCSTPEHTVRFAKDEDSMYITFFLSFGPWYERLFVATKYLFGYKCRYGHFDEIVLGRKEVENLVRILKEETPDE